MTVTETPITTGGRGNRLLLEALLLGLIVALIAALFFCGWVFLRRIATLYRGHIYPNIYALGVQLEGLTPEQGAAALEAVAERVAVGSLVFTDGAATYPFSAAEAGLRVDTRATAEAAYTIGRSDDLRSQTAVWITYQDVPPTFTVDAMRARVLLEQLALEISVPPVPARLQLEQGQLIIVPGESGRVLNIEGTLVQLLALPAEPGHITVPLVFETVTPPQPDAELVREQVTALTSRRIELFAYDVLTNEMLTWALESDTLIEWLYLEEIAGEPQVSVDPAAARATLEQLAAALGDGRGFRYEEATRQLLDIFTAGGGRVQLYLTHPERVYTVRQGDTLTSISAQFGMPPGLVMEANPQIDYDRLSVGQTLIIPSQDLLTPYMPILDRRIVISIAEQRLRVYENGALLYDWPTSTGMADSPTLRGVFQIVSKEENAYASQWDLWMPYFMAIYPAGGTVYNGIHELPILQNGQRLWEGNLGRPASFGCIILGIPQAETLFRWADIGVIVAIE